MGKYFGTDGIRGKANVYPMSPDFVLKLGQAIGYHFAEEHSSPKILIGKDTRRSCYMLEQALCSGICSVGVEALFLGPLPTPGIAYLTRGMRASAGIVISASHNPFDDNGIKIFSANGFKLPDEVENHLESLIEKNSLANNLPIGMGIGRAKRIEDAVGQYSVFLKEQFPKRLTLDGLRLVVDCSNGAAYKVAPKVFGELGAEVFLIGNEPNGENINDSCGALYPQVLRERVMLYKADLGIGLDGDADRLIVVDEKGDIVDGDEIMAICAKHMIEKNTLAKKAVVATVMSNLGFEIAMKKFGGELIRTKVGDRYVVDAMRKGGYNLGGEQSGHLIFSDSSTTGDGILAALKLLEIMIEKDDRISNLKKCMESLPQVLKNLMVREKVPLEKLPTLEKEIEKMEQKLNGKGRILFRYSGTEPKARVMIEGENQSEINQMADELVDSTKKAIDKYLDGAK